jgi:glyoxylase-like metal-dependent hydrolase (beta-lactamase superfamily II)
MQVQHFFDPRTSSLTYVVHDPATRDAVVIDPVTDYDPKSGRVGHESAEKVAVWLRENDLRLHFALDTHPHADHLTALPWFREHFGARTGISSGITRIQETWREVFHLGPDFPVDGRQFDVLLREGQPMEAGSLRIDPLLTEGHTPASMTFAIGDALFVGDLLFMPDAGTARCDFPGGSAATMYQAVHSLYRRFPDSTRVFTLHDYQPGGRALAFQSTLGEQRRENIHIHEGITQEQFVELRARLEQGKELPTLLFPSVQVNIAGGALPPPESNGVSYLKIPLNRF